MQTRTTRSATTKYSAARFARNPLGILVLGVMAAVLAVPTAAVAAGGSGDIAGFSGAVADAGGKNKNKGANKGRNNNNRANRGNNNRSNRNANRGNNNRSNRNANRGNNRNNNSGANSSRSTRPNNAKKNNSKKHNTPPTPNMFKNSGKNFPHYDAMGKDHANHKQIKKGSQGYNRDRGYHHDYSDSRRGNNNKNKNSKGHRYDDYGHGHNHGHHHNHNNNHKKKVVKKKVVNKYYGYGGHGHHSHYGYGYYRPRAGFSVYIGSGVYAGHHSHYDSHYDPYYDDTYCRTTTYTRYGNYGTATYKRTTCSTDAYGGYNHRPVRVNNTYIYNGTDYDGYRDYQDSTYYSNTTSARGYANPSAQTADYVETTPSPAVADTQELERVGMVGPWGDLVNSKAAEAQDIFDQIAKDYPEDGLPQLGFAVASAQRGQYTSAAAAVERALEIDPASVDRMPESVALRDEIRGLADELRRSNGDGLSRSQYWVTVAAFAYMGGDPYRARVSLEQASQNGASDLVVRGLRDRIER